MKTVNDPILMMKRSVTYSYMALSPALFSGYSGGPVQGSCAPCHHQRRHGAAFVPSTAACALLVGTAENMHGRHQDYSDLTEVSSPSYITESLITSPQSIKWGT